MSTFSIRALTEDCEVIFEYTGYADEDEVFEGFLAARNSREFASESGDPITLQAFNADTGHIVAEERHEG